MINIPELSEALRASQASPPKPVTVPCVGCGHPFEIDPRYPADVCGYCNDAKTSVDEADAMDSHGFAEDNWNENKDLPA